MENKISILSTRPVSEQQVQIAAEKDIIIDIISFIETEPIENVEVQQEIESALLRPAIVIFTSMNAVEAVSQLLDEKPSWRIYCIGHTTKQLAINYFGAEAIAGTAPDATELAELIIAEADEDSSVIFFCGDQRRDELPRLLKEQDIEVEEIVVYETVLVPHKIKKDYHGILFFSPSAVTSFFSTNKVAAETKMFAIGRTTAETLVKYGNNNIILPEEPTKHSLVEKMLEYFSGS